MNPFEELEKKILTGVEKLLKEKKDPVAPNTRELKYIPVTELIAKKVCSRATLYAHYKSGHFSLYKFGGKTFVDREEFEKAFRKVQIRILKAD